MIRESCGLLERILALAAGAGPVPVRMKKLLLCLVEELELADAGFLCLGETQGHFVQSISARGPELLTPCSLPLDQTPAAAVFAQKAPLDREGELHLPAATGETIVGLLTLHLHPTQRLSTDQRRLLPLMAGQLALLAELLQRLQDQEERAADLRQLQLLTLENERKYRELSLLHRVALAMHSTLRLNQLIHLVLSAATISDPGCFERAMLFTLNQRSGVLQGMLGVNREAAGLALPLAAGALTWEQPNLSAEVLTAQRETGFSRAVMKQRLPSAGEDNPLAQALQRGRVVFVRPGSEKSPDIQVFEQALQLGSYACAPLVGRERPLGVLVVDSSEFARGMSADCLRFLQLFASQAGSAMENSLLLHRLETAHKDLRDTQERLIQGEKLAVLGEMAASIAHELKTPLVSIGGFANRLLRSLPPGSSEQEYAAIVQRESRRLEEMLGHILGFSKRQLLCFSECALRDVLEEALALEADALALAGIQVVRDYAPERLQLKGDAQKLRQILLNLIANARQAMEGGGMLRVELRPARLRAGPAVEVVVEDTGGGIPPEIRQKIFTPFFTTKERGTGLGLAISQRIAAQHHGELRLEEGDLGARVVLRLPV
jgi:two-component system, NtrC family, sensor histidine kinase HydH